MDIRELRKSISLSQFKLSRMLGVADITLSKWERNKEPLPLEMRERITEIIDDLKANPKKLESILKKKGVSSFHGQKGSRKTPPKLNKPSKKSNFTRNLESPIKALDFFSGCGGLTYGLHLAGVDVVGHCEIVSAFSDVYQHNFPWSVNLGSDVSQIDESNLRSTINIDEIDLIVGGPPCQGFSLAGWRDPEDERNKLFNEFVRIGNIIQPKAIILENVGLLSSLKDGNEKPYLELISEALNENYSVSVETLDAADFGVAQHRNRIFFVGIRKDLSHSFSFPKQTHSSKPGFQKLVTLRDAIGHLEVLESGEWGEHPLHWAVDHPAHVIEWLKATPEGKSAHENEDPKLRPPSGYNTTYKRLVYDEPGATITTASGMISASRTVHPINTRSLTILESSLIQSFPTDFAFFGNWGSVRKMIGNAVPPLLGKAIGASIIEAII